MSTLLSRGFFICGHSPRILARASRRASTVCQPRKFRYLPPVNGHFRSLAWSAALLLCPARTDIGCTPVSSLHFPCRVHIVPTAPEFPVPVFIFLLRELLVQHQAAFSFQLPHETCYCYLWRYLDQHVDVVQAYLCFDNLDPFPIAQRPQNASNFSSFLSEEHFPSVFWRKHYMIFAIPTGMR